MATDDSLKGLADVLQKSLIIKKYYRDYRNSKIRLMKIKWLWACNYKGTKTLCLVGVG
jgi:hypothetical protein